MACCFDYSDVEHFAVVCVPSYFSKSSRDKIAKCAEKVGFEVVDVIDEARSAMVAYGVGCSQDTEEKQRMQLDPQKSRKAMAKLTLAAETCKHVLSTMSTEYCFVENLCGGIDLDLKMSRARFESLISPVLQDYIDPADDDFMNQINIKTEDIAKVILCGGSMKIPKFQQIFADKFTHAEVLSGLNPDEVIAIGAAKWCRTQLGSLGTDVPTPIRMNVLSDLCLL